MTEGEYVLYKTKLAIQEEVAAAAAVSVDLLGYARSDPNGLQIKAKGDESARMYVDQNYVSRKRKQLQVEHENALRSGQVGDAVPVLGETQSVLSRFGEAGRNFLSSLTFAAPSFEEVDQELAVRRLKRHFTMNELEVF
jgi:hypothetical protein